MQYTARVSVPVAAETAWSTVAALRSWPDWTPTVESVDCTGDEPVVGLEVGLKQPGRRLARYTVDLVDPGRRFRWGSRRLGVVQSADHVVTPDGDGACTVELSFAMAGPVGGVLARLGAGRIRSMVDTEAASLRRHLAPT